MNIIRVKKTADFEVTGLGGNVVWESAIWHELKLVKGSINYWTKFKVLYSDTGIYCLFNCEDNVITSTIRKDFSDLFNEDVVEVFFWPDEANPIYFEYELSPHNYELPILVPNHKGDFYGWLPWGFTGPRKTRHQTFIETENDVVKGWRAEFFIPYELMRPLQNISPKPGMQWRANFYRIDYDSGQTLLAWNPVKESFHEYHNFGIIEFE